MEINVTGGYVSADGHVVEPADLWTTRMDKRFRDRAPRVESKPEADFYIIDGLEPLPVGLEGVSMEDKIAGEIISPQGRRHADTRPGAWDPQARLTDQEMDHLRAEVMYPGVGLFLSAAPDAAYQRECFRVYNDWLSEFCAAAPDRFLGVGLLPLRGPVEWAIEEAERIAQKGLRSISIPAEIAARPYRSTEYDPLWEVLQDIGLPISMHVGTDEPFYMKADRMGVGKAFVDTKFAPWSGPWPRSSGPLSRSAIPGCALSWPRAALAGSPRCCAAWTTGGPTIGTGWNRGSMQRPAFISAPVLGHV